MSFETVVQQRETGMRFWLEIQGLPYLFADGAIPTSPAGAAWDSTPELPDDGSVSPLPCSIVQVFDTRGGLVDSGAEITRSSGDVTPSSMKFTLRETGSDTLLALFARHKTTGLTADLIADVPYGDGGSPGVTELYLSSMSGWTAGDLVYFGRETLEVISVEVDHLSCYRNNFALTGSQSRFVLDSERANAPRVISNYPRVWVGRYVRLWAFPVTADGTAYDDDWHGDNAREVWRGVINADPRVGSDWSSWEISADSIESILRTEIGSESRTGTLLRVPGGLQQNVAGTVDPPPGAPMPQVAYWVDENVGRVDVRVSKWTDQAAKDAGDDPTDTWSYIGEDAIVVFSDATIVTRSVLRAGLETAISTTLKTDTGIPSFEITTGANSGRWYFRIGSSTAIYVAEFNWDADNSIGRLIGWSGLLTVGTSQSVITPKSTGDVAVFISKNANRIPFFYESGITSMAAAPAAGYAIIGDDKETEVVKYSSVTTLFNDLEGLYILEGCERGRFGTVAKDHAAPYPTGDTSSDAVKVQFGIGWEDTTFPEVLLQLATSTGAAVNGTYDVLPDGFGGRLSLEHFDPAAFTRMGERLAAWEVRRPMLLVKGMKLSELIGAWFQPVGAFILGRSLSDGTYRISIGQALPPIESDADTAITTTNIALEPAPKYGAAGRIINQVRAFYHWNPANSEATDTAYVDVLHDDSIAEYGSRNKIEWKLPGWTTDSGTALAAVLDWSSDVFRRYGRPFDIITFDTDRTAWLLAPGDTITLTIPGFPSTRGTRGEETNAIVLQVEKRYSGDEIGGSLRVAIEAPDRHGRYVPSARVLTWDGSTGVTLSLNVFSVSGDFDYSHFQAGDVVWVYEDEADVTTRVMRTIDTITDDDVVFTVALVGFTPGADTLVTFYDYGSATARERTFAYVAGNDGEYTSGTPAEGFRYA